MIEALYSTVGFVIAASYLPQIHKLVTAQTQCLTIAIATWLIWDYTSVVSLLYSIHVVEDSKLFVVNVVNVLCVNLVIAITLYKRWKYTNVIIIAEEDDALQSIQETVGEFAEAIEEATEEMQAG